ncbi:hypothetical protein ABSA28_00371 [Candidatus Hepatincolaceae symbiont of Richtersius coronifer]
MFLIRSLTSYCKLKKLGFLILLLSLISGCTNLYMEKNISNNIYVSDIPELSGIIIRNHILAYFPNTNYQDTAYILKINPIITKELYLTSLGGFGTKGRVRISIQWQLIDKATKKNLLSINNQFIGTYNVEPSSYATENNETKTIENLTILISRDISLKVYSFIKKFRNENSPT